MRTGASRFGVVGLLFLVGLLPGPAWCGSVARQHDGFFLRLSPGFGHASTRLDDGADEWHFSGGTGDMDIAIGGIVSRNLALHGTLWGWTMGDPDLEVNNDGVFFNGNVTLSAIGGGVTYYVMPLNLYFSGSLGFARIGFDNSGFPDTDTGLAFEGVIGKEWWVSRNWALGLSGALGAHSVDDDLVSDNWHGSNIAVRFSATFN